MKKIILSQKQLDEICGDNSTYLDGLALTPDIENNFANEITPNGKIDGGYSKPLTTDDFAETLTNNVRGYFGLRGAGSVSTIREMSKKEWEEKILNEDNERLKYRKFGATDNSEGKGYYATKKNINRFNKASQTAKNGNPVEKAKALKTMQRMQQNWSGLSTAINQYETAKRVDNQIKPGIKSAPKNSGNGKAHSKKNPNNGIFTS